MMTVRDEYGDKVG